MDMGSENRTEMKTKISNIEYLWICISQGWHNFAYSFRNWGDLMGGNHEGYGILPEDDDLEWCIGYFWDSLDEGVYSKEFLEYLHQLLEDVNSGKEKLIPYDNLDDLMKNLEDDLDSM
jgi:hypothetical protein